MSAQRAARWHHPLVFLTFAATSESPPSSCIRHPTTQERARFADPCQPESHVSCPTPPTPRASRRWDPALGTLVLDFVVSRSFGRNGFVRNDSFFSISLVVLLPSTRLILPSQRSSSDTAFSSSTTRPLSRSNLHKIPHPFLPLLGHFPVSLTTPRDPSPAGTSLTKNPST
jgi:hypothetical protein